MHWSTSRSWTERHTPRCRQSEQNQTCIAAFARFASGALNKSGAQTQAKARCAKATISDKIVGRSSKLDPRKNSHGRNVMSRWKIQAAATALVALTLAATASLPVCARELQPLATTTPEQVGASAERLGRITTMLKKEIAEGKLPGAVVMVA